MAFGKRTPAPGVTTGSSGSNGAGGNGSGGSGPGGEGPDRNGVVMAAANDIAQALLGAYQTERGVHAESVIGAAASITADSARKNSLNAIPGVHFASGSAFGMSSADGVLLENDDSAWNMITALAESRLGIAAAQLPSLDRVVAQTAAAQGSENFPPLSVPREHYPTDWSPLAGPRLRPSIDVISDHHGLQGDERTLACAIATFSLIQQTQEVLRPIIGLTLALEMLVGVSRIPVDVLENMTAA